MKIQKQITNNLIYKLIILSNFDIRISNLT